MDISEKTWTTFAKRLSSIDQAATEKVKAFVEGYNGFSFEDPECMNDFVDYAYGISTKYGEAAAEVACQMYDAVAEASGVHVPAAEPAPTQPYGEVDGVLRKITEMSTDENYLAGQVGRFVKQTGADTTLKNAKRDHAEFAWIPGGSETCAYCLTLASAGWRTVVNSDHAEHIHGNCDCTFAVRFNSNTNVKGYDPKKYEKMYYSAPLKEGQKESAKNRLNALRRQLYEKNHED